MCQRNSITTPVRLRGSFLSDSVVKCYGNSQGGKKEMLTYSTSISLRSRMSKFQAHRNGFSRVHILSIKY